GTRPRHVERAPRQAGRLVARLVERPRQVLRRVLGGARGHPPPCLHHARRRVAQAVALRLLADEPQQRRDRFFRFRGRKLKDSCILLWQDVSLRTMFYKLIIVKAILLSLLATNVTAQSPQSDRLARGTAQVRAFWRSAEGDEAQVAGLRPPNGAGD